MNIPKLVQDLSKKLSGKIYHQYDMKLLNWFNLGGPAKVFFKPNTLEDLIFFLKNFSNNLPIIVLGVGSNTLIRDGGYNGVIIKLGKYFSRLSKLDNNTIIAGSAVLDKQLSNFAKENSIAGLEFLSCIPGSIGGAIRMNSGCYGFDISKSIVSIQTLDHNGIVRTIRSEKINFFYRGSDLSNDQILLSGTFNFINFLVFPLFFFIFLYQTEPLNIILPGAIALILTPCLPKTFDVIFTYEFNAAFATEYVVGAPSTYSNPHMEDIQIITPLDLTKCFFDSSITFVALKKFFSKLFFQCL